MSLTQERLKEILHYDPLTGIFTWLVANSNRININDVAGSLKDGYIRIKIDNEQYYAHRLAWLYVYGYFPEHQIDHKNGIENQNWISNLKEATPTCQNQNRKVGTNNSSGFIGVGWNKDRKKWRSRIDIHGKQILIGIYNDPVSAALARVAYEDGSPDWTCNHQQVNRIKLRELGYQV